jgi:D-amino-acid dehydrogenase
LTLQPNAPVTVIGAGVVGTACAYMLQRAGVATTLIDRDEPGRGCSFGNAGSVSPGAVAPLAMPGVLFDVPGWLLKPGGPLSLQLSYLPAALPWLIRFLRSADPARVARISAALQGLLAPAIDLYRGLLADIGAPELLRQTGQLQLYGDARGRARDQAIWDLRRSRGVTVEFVDADAIRALEPEISPEFKAGVFLPNEGMIANPFRLVQALARRFAELGGTVRRGEVRALRPGVDGAIAIETDGGPMRAERLVIAAGAWSAALSAQLGDRAPLQTQRGYHLTLPEGRLAIRRPVVVAEAKCFISPMETGIRVAGTVEIARLDSPPRFARARALVAPARRAFPGLEFAKAAEWMGDRPCTPDSLPVIGPSSRHPAVFYAFGHGHLGLTAAPNTARIIQALLTREPVPLDLKPFHISRF